MIIIGSGLSGLLAANFFRREKPIILEKQNKLPNNHKALLRFRTDKVSKIIGIPFKEVTVTKSIWFNNKHNTESTLNMVNKYSHKVTGTYQNRSIINLEPSKRYIAPEDLISKMSEGIDIQYESNVTSKTFDEIYCNEQIISTMPMASLMKILHWPTPPEFKTKQIYTITATIDDCDLYQTIYFPEEKLPYYRISITGNKLIVEMMQPIFDVKDIKAEIFIIANRYFGISNEPHSIKSSTQQYGKLIETDKKTCREFISWATRKYKIYSVGRWALHRQILMDDVADDLNVVSQLIESNNYHIVKG